MIVPLYFRGEDLKMLKFQEVKTQIELLKNTLPNDDRYAVLNYLVAMVEQEARDLGRIIAREERQIVAAGYQQASGG
jgi:hypothetical protein